MTREQRDLVRTLIDQAKRVQVDAIRDRLSSLFCAGCGMELEDWTPGCPRCADRWRKKAHRGTLDADLFERTRRKVHRTIAALAIDRSREMGFLGGQTRIGKPPVSTWADHRAGLGVKDDGRLIKTERKWL